MSKRMCDLSKKDYKKLDKSDAKYCCGICGRKARKKKRLCEEKPKKL